MNHVLTGSGISLTYLQDPRARAAIDWAQIFEDLAEAGAPPYRFWWCDLANLTHVILATDRKTGRHAGLIGLVEPAVAHERRLVVEAAMVRPGEDCDTLLRAMLAHVLARVVVLDGKPAAIVCGRAGPVIEPALRDLAQYIPGASVFPPAMGNLVSFPTASLARRIGGDGLVVDLRLAPETGLLRELRRLHRVRVERKKPRVRAAAMAKSARSAGATRRPKTAIHTGTI